jgi:hypothetical protein
VGLETFWLIWLILFVFKLLKFLFLLCLNRRLNKGGSLGLDNCCDDDFEPLIVEGIGGFVGAPFDKALIVDFEPTLLLLLVEKFMASIAFVLKSGS